MDLRKLIGPAFAALLIGAVGGGIWYSHSNVRAERDMAEQKQLEASRQIILHGLVTDHFVTERDGNYFVTDMPALLALMKRQARWKDVPGNTAFSTNKAVLLNSTDVRTSNSAAMYLSLASYLENGQAVVESQDEIPAA